MQFQASHAVLIAMLAAVALVVGLVCVVTSDNKAQVTLQETPFRQDPGGRRIRRLKSRMQAVIAAASLRSNATIQLSYIDAEGREFTVTSSQSGLGVGSDDTFLFGSGTKPLTAVQTFKAVERGQLHLDGKVGAYLDKALLANTGRSFEELFGQMAANVTILNLLQMRSGLMDFDHTHTDELMLNHTWSPYKLLLAALRACPEDQRMLFPPGSQTQYSSTNYVLLGLVLAAVDGVEWDELDQRALFQNRQQFHRSHFLDRGPLTQRLTVPGVSRLYGGAPIKIYDQPSEILGYTCGNLVAPTIDMARFFKELLVTKSLVSTEQLDVMQDYHVMSFGDFGVDMLRYGAGLMMEQVSPAGALPARLGDWGTYVGHGGMTYGFISEQGMIPQLNATFSVVKNHDKDVLLVAYVLVCELIQEAAKIYRGEVLDLSCGEKNVDKDLTPKQLFEETGLKSAGKTPPK